MIADAHHGREHIALGDGQAQAGQFGIGINGGLHLGDQFVIGGGIVGGMVVRAEVQRVLLAVERELEAGVWVVIQRISMAAVNHGQSAHGVDELRIQRARGLAVLAREVLRIKVNREIHAAGISIGEADRGFRGFVAHVLNTKGAAAVVRTEGQHLAIGQVHIFGVEVGVGQIAARAAGSLLNVEENGFHILDFRRNDVVRPAALDVGIQGVVAGLAVNVVTVVKGSDFGVDIVVARSALNFVVAGGELIGVAEGGGVHGEALGLAVHFIMLDGVKPGVLEVLHQHFHGVGRVALLHLGQLGIHVRGSVKAL